MRGRKVFRTVLALGVAASLHLVALNALAQQRTEVLIQGGRLQVELGINAKSSPEVVAGDMPSSQEEPPVVETEAHESKTEPPVERRDDPQKEKAEPKTQPKPEPVKAVKEQTPPTQSKDKPEEKVTEATPPPMPEGGAPSLPSAGSDADAAGVPQPESDSGNAASQNYAGEVMKHLSGRRRPRASGAGFARVAFSLTSSGNVENIRISTSSGVSKFDREAFKFVKRAAPFPKPPADVKRDFVVKIEGK